jgi:hypothetical protein
MTAIDILFIGVPFMMLGALLGEFVSWYWD